MNNFLENGLPLGLRFYDELEKQRRFKHTCAQGVLHNEYQYTDNCDVPPWQIVRVADPSEDITVTMICADDGTEWDLNTECPDMIADIQVATVGIYDYITYPADHSCCGLGVFNKTLVYLRVEDTISTWYSELFWIDPGANGGDLDTFYRLWLPGHIRSVDANDLRIWR